MRDRLLRLTESAEVAIASANGVIDPHELQPLREAVRSLRMRLGYPEDLLVAVLAGGTGSGKSSLFNALVGGDIAEVGGVRPTTEVAMAAVPIDHIESMTGLLDHLEIDRWHSYEGPFFLVDLPDYDSVESSHRETVDRLLPLVDVVVWVVDPEKYRDARLHHEYLQPLAVYQNQFVFVLNQTDRLDSSARQSVLDDLDAALSEDGIDAAPVIAVAARPGSGPPVDVDLLIEHLEQLKTRDAGMEKLGVDITSIASTLSTRLGSGLDFDQRAADVVEVAADDVVAGQIQRAASRLIRFLEEIATSADGPVGEAIRRGSADVPRHLARIADLSTPEPIRSRLGRVKETPPPARDYVVSMINTDVIRPARTHLAKRALAVAAIAEFVVESRGIRSWG